MNTIRKGLVALLLTTSVLTTTAQSKRISDFSIVYNYSLLQNGKENAAFGATHTVYIKGNLSRTEVNSQLVSFSTIHDATTGSSVVLRELNGQKLLIRMNAEDWQDRNQRFQNIHFTNTSESKLIAGYKCIKAVAAAQDSTRIVVWYTRDLVPDNKEYEAQFRNLEGLPIEYEIERGTTTLRYMMSSINLNPVPASKFDIPTSGYREMTYAESKNLR